MKTSKRKLRVYEGPHQNPRQNTMEEKRAAGKIGIKALGVILCSGLVDDLYVAQLRRGWTS